LPRWSSEPTYARNGDPEHDDTSLLRAAAEMARQGNVTEMVVGLATGVAAAYQEHIDAERSRSTTSAICSARPSARSSGCTAGA
jgi:hypothetical protein